jgi:hypothetical protein
MYLVNGKCQTCPIGKTKKCGKCICPDSFEDMGEGRSCRCPIGSKLSKSNGAVACMTEDGVKATGNLAATISGAIGSPEACSTSQHAGCGGTTCTPPQSSENTSYDFKAVKGIESTLDDVVKDAKKHIPPNGITL